MHRSLPVIIISLVAILSLAGSAGAAETWTVDNVHSSILMRIRHNDVSWVFCRFNQKSGTITVDPADPSRSSIEFSVDPASFDSGNEKRDAHVMSPDFLSVKEFPKMGFHSTKVESTGKGKYKVTGTLEIKGVSKQVTFDVSESRGKGMKGEELAGWYTEFSIKRRDYNITEFSDSALSDEVVIYVSLEAARS